MNHAIDDPYDPPNVPAFEVQLALEDRKDRKKPPKPRSPPVTPKRPVNKKRDSKASPPKPKKPRKFTDLEKRYLELLQKYESGPLSEAEQWFAVEHPQIHVVS